MLEDAKKTGKSTFGMSKETTALGFQKGGPIETTPTTVSGQIQSRKLELLPADKYIQQLKIQLGLIKDIDKEGNEIYNSETRAYQLTVRKAVAEQEILARLQARSSRSRRGDVRTATELQNSSADQHR